VKNHWRLCPNCDAGLTERSRRLRQYRRPDLDVRLDQKATGCGTIILVVLGFLGCLVIPIWGWLLFGVLVLLSLLSASFRTSADPNKPQFGKVFGAALRGHLYRLGILVLAGVALVAALLVFLFARCLITGRI
jgi:hypothetical protein